MHVGRSKVFVLAVEIVSKTLVWYRFDGTNSKWSYYGWPLLVDVHVILQQEHTRVYFFSSLQMNNNLVYYLLPKNTSPGIDKLSLMILFCLGISFFQVETLC